MYVITTKKFDKQFKKQNVEVRSEFKKRVDLFLLDSQHFVLNTHKLSGKYKGMFSFNVPSDIRVIFEKRTNDLIMLVAIGSHSELYS